MDLASLGVDEGKVIENPAPNLWALYHQMDRWNKLPEWGGLLDQSYILMAELDTLDRILTSRRQQAEVAEAQRQKAQQTQR